MRYVFKWKRHFFWHKRIVIGHHYDKEQNKLVLVNEDGGIFEIRDWTKCKAHLKADWVAAIKANMEKQAGQSIVVQPS